MRLFPTRGNLVKCDYEDAMLYSTNPVVLNLIVHINFDAVVIP